MLSLSEADRRSVLHLARQAVVQAVAHRQPLEVIPQEGIFGQRRGVFVTLHVGKRLRGCIGLIEAKDPLGEALIRCASGAALQDPRFSPLKPDQLGELSIEISLLSPMEPIVPESIEIGRHGLLVALHAQRGLLLPQVAIEHRLTREEFLAETCRKAGLPREAWRDPQARIFGFTSEVFSDNSHREAT